jgi:hypothetical protein
MRDPDIDQSLRDGLFHAPPLQSERFTALQLELIRRTGQAQAVFHPQPSGSLNNSSRRLLFAYGAPGHRRWRPTPVMQKSAILWPIFRADAILGPRRD